MGRRHGRRGGGLHLVLLVAGQRDVQARGGRLRKWLRRRHSVVGVQVVLETRDQGVASSALPVTVKGEGGERRRGGGSEP